MSVATELTRIQSAKAALKTSIRNKGVSVSDNALISEYPALVDAIETGGGGDNAMKENVQGTLTSYTIPNDVTSIRGHAFHGCSSLESVIIPDSVRIISDYAFAGCTNLPSITIPNSVESISGYAFSECYKLSSIVIPGSVKIIGAYSFYDCQSLESVTITDGVETIDFYAFQNCQSLESVTIPESVTNIGTEIFMYCNSLKYVKFIALMPPNIDNYENMYSSMGDILVPESAVSDYVTAFPLWENRIFADTHTHDYSVTELRYSNQTGSTPFTQLSDTTLNTSNVSLNNLRMVYIGNNVTAVDNGTFLDTGSTAIFIPETNSLETIGVNAFNNANVVGDFHLPNVTSIGDLAFNYNSHMLSVTIGDRITSIGEQAFNGCYKLKSVTCLATTPPTLGSSAFYSTAEYPIYVPAESVEAYKATAGWNAYTSRIQAIPSV